MMTWGSSAQCSMWRADEDKIIRVELRDCEAAAEDGIPVGVEVVENSFRFKRGRQGAPYRSFEIRYYLYKDKLWWMGAYKWVNRQVGTETRAERRFLCYAAPLEEPNLQPTRN